MHFFPFARRLDAIVAYGVVGMLHPALLCAEELLRPNTADKVESSITANKPLVNDEVAIAPAHPLRAVIKYAQAERRYMQSHLQSVTCRLTKRERIEGELQKSQFIDLELEEAMLDGDVLVRPMRAFLSFLGPGEVTGRKVLFIEGANKGKMLVRKGGKRFNYAIVKVDPKSDMAQRESLVPITDLGFCRQLDRQIEVLKSHARIDPRGVNTTVEHGTDAKINGRLCEVIRVTHEERQPGLTFHRVNVFIDTELHIPVRIDAVDWPEEAGGKCPLLAEYTYTNVRLNVDLPEATFDEDRLKQ